MQFWSALARIEELAAPTLAIRLRSHASHCVAPIGSSAVYVDALDKVEDGGRFQPVSELQYSVGRTSVRTAPEHVIKLCLAAHSKLRILLTMGAEQRDDTDTIPATPRSRRAPAVSTTDLGTSGVRPAATSPSEPGDEAHAEMLRAVDRGVCMIVSENSAEDGTMLQWSAWLVERELVCQAWFRSNDRRWSKGPSFMVSGERATSLADMLQARR